VTGASTPRIREAGASDAAAIADVHVRSWRTAYRGFAPDAYLDAPATAEGAHAYWQALFGAAMPGLVTWIAESDGTVLGFVNISPPLATPAPDEMVPPGCGFLHHIHLAPEAVGGGLGRALFEVALERLAAQGFAEAVLWVYGPNTRARGFYQAMGWRHDGIVEPHLFRGGGAEVIVPNLRYRGPTAR
jgi:GNAT superfamily N-acetyltransferase